ncbi:hypothetical protein VNO78_08832 [Psophocarpus tetragonolobus]|uniref:Uncharacterized protein n=1 Tax=Psophocarpus tetragonolobus TaxID=3891 RepID=A0AAN9XT81_PSOTE
MGAEVEVGEGGRNLAGETVGRECKHIEALGEGAEGVWDGAGELVAVEGDSGEDEEGREPGREGAGEFAIGDLEWGNDVGVVGDEQILEVRKVSDGEGNRNGFGEVKFVEAEAVYAVCLGLGAACHTYLAHAAVGFLLP